MTVATSHQIKQEYIQAMGQELGQVFYQLYFECNWLHWKWIEYLEMFSEKTENTDLLNDVVPGFAYIIELALWNDILLHICRMTDSSKTGNHANLSIQILPDLVDHTIKDKIRASIQDIKDKCSFARDLRMKHIAHKDYVHAVDSKITPLDGGSIKQVREAISAITSLLNDIECYYHNSTVAYGSMRIKGGADYLIDYLKKGKDCYDIH